MDAVFLNRRAAKDHMYSLNNKIIQIKPSKVKSPIELYFPSIFPVMKFSDLHTL